MKRSLILLITLSLLLCSCSGGGGNARGNSDTTGLSYADNMYIPPTPELYGYSYKGVNLGSEKLGELVEAAFGDKEYSRGTLLNDESFDAACWIWDEKTDGGNAEAMLFQNGAFNVILSADGSSDLGDALPTVKNIYFKNEYEGISVSLGGTSCSLSDLDSKAKDRLSSCLSALGAGTDIESVFAREILHPDSGVIEAEFTYALKLGGGSIRSILYDDWDIIRHENERTTATALTPHFKVVFSSPECFYIASDEGLAGEICKEGEPASVTSDKALELANKVLEEKGKKMTAHMIQPEYTPVMKNVESYSLEPYWAIYCTDGADRAWLVAVSARSGDVTFIEISL